MSFYQPKLVAPIGTIDGANRDYTVPTEFIGGSLKVFHNGVLLDKDGGPNYDGWTETSPTTFRMNFAPLEGDTLFVFYNDPDGYAVESAGKPQMLQALELAPMIRQMLELDPSIVAVEPGVDLLPRIYQTCDLIPDIEESVELVPRIVSAETV